MATRRTKAEIRAERIAKLARQKQELEDLLRAEQREAAKDAKRALVAAEAVLGKAVREALGATTADEVGAILEALVADGALDHAKAALAFGENENAAEGKGVDNVPEESETEDADASDGDGSDDASDANGSDSEADEVAEEITSDVVSSGFSPWGG